MTIVCLDFMNAVHRARSGFLLGDNPVIFNFFRGLRAQVDQFKPTRLYVVLEGHPAARHEVFADYKANRVVSEDDPKHAELQKLFRQRDTIVDILSRHFPVSVVRHPTSEADDTIVNLTKRSSSATDWTVLSSDSDFIQLVQDLPNVKLYNPIRKSFVEAPVDYNYLTWKSLRGDSSDNIPGIPGCGDKTAARVAADPDLLEAYLSKPGVAQIFERNYELIKFADWSDEEAMQMTSSAPVQDWGTVRYEFAAMGFQSMTSDTAWKKFTTSFNYLFN